MVCFFKKAALIFLLSILPLPLFSANALPQERLSESDKKFLIKLEKDIFDYFWKEANPRNGLIKDSSRVGAPSSIAACGFGLTAICIGAERGWVDHDRAYNRVLKTLITFRDKVPNEHGFFYHFLDMRTGKRVWECEISSIDTALFLAGALFAGEYFKGTEVEKVATALYRRVDWPWLMKNNLISMGWKPETGIFPSYWDSYSEAMILYALAIGSPTYPIKAKSWSTWKRSVAKYGDYELIYCSTGSLFTYQYSHAWIDFRKLDDQGINWFKNSIEATKANRKFCIDQQNHYRTYGPNIWGLTASLGPSGYRGYGAKPGHSIHDGTICPYGAGGSIAFTPKLSISALRHMYNRYGNKVYKKYGFIDAFNVDKKWHTEECLGISLGVTMLMIENYRSKMVWKYFMKNRYIKKWVFLCFDSKDEDDKR
ncbi:MAG: hypothetical protein KAJ66_03790 [Candidatus Omnitrophica bacterium]|nr:hypothetical protein [Candidatus Omnitrophota bacterium]